MLTPGLRMFALFLAEEVQYSSQTKERCKSITKVKITDFNDITREFQKIFRANPEYWETHVEVLEKLAESFKNLTASEKAEKLQVGNSVSAAYKLKNELGSKLVDATAGPSERWDTELFLAEGLSASGSLVKGRKSSKYHAIMPLRGRVLNVDGLSVDQMLENKEFYTIFRSIGVGLDVNYVGSDCSSPEEAFEKIKKSSRYGKIIISTDAD
jgi:DNA gyrase/topoisomerase IV subunit B